MFHVHRKHNVGDGVVNIGSAETVDELHELLREIPKAGVYSVSSDEEGTRPVRLELDAGVGDDRAFVDQIVTGLHGGPDTLVIAEP